MRIGLLKVTEEMRKKLIILLNIYILLIMILKICLNSKIACKYLFSSYTKNLINIIHILNLTLKWFLNILSKTTLERIYFQA